MNDKATSAQAVLAEFRATNQPYLSSSARPWIKRHAPRLIKAGKIVEVWEGTYSLTENAAAAKVQIDEINAHIHSNRPQGLTSPPDYEGLILARQESQDGDIYL